MLFVLLLLFSISAYGLLFTLLVSGALNYIFKDNLYYEDELSWWNKNVSYIYMTFFVIMVVTCVWYFVLK